MPPSGGLGMPPKRGAITTEFSSDSGAMDSLKNTTIGVVAALFAPEGNTCTISGGPSTMSCPSMGSTAPFPEMAPDPLWQPVVKTHTALSLQAARASTRGPRRSHGIRDGWDKGRVLAGTEPRGASGPAGRPRGASIPGRGVRGPMRG